MEYKNIINIEGIFAGCSSLTSLPDLSKWNTNNINNMAGIFHGCSSLISIPDISKWNTNNITDIAGIFYGCSSLTYYLIYLNGIQIKLKV